VDTLWLTWFGILITTATAVASALSDERERPYKVVIIACAGVGAIAACVGAYFANVDATDSKTSLSKVQHVTDELNALESIGKDGKFYVRLAAGMTETVAKKYRDDTLATFPAPSMILCRTYGKQNTMYELTFGVHLSLVAAKAYAEVGNPYAEGKRSFIVPEPEMDQSRRKPCS
jgi:hypothetical protein